MSIWLTLFWSNQAVEKVITKRHEIPRHKVEKVIVICLYPCIIIDASSHLWLRQAFWVHQLIQVGEALFQVICSLCNTEQDVSKVSRFYFMKFKTIYIVELSSDLHTICSAYTIRCVTFLFLHLSLYKLTIIFFCFLGSTNMPELWSVYGRVLL